MDKIKEHLTTKNSRGFMHPISNMGKEFLVFSKRNYPVIEMGCAYGNLVIEALKNGVRKIIACDMESQHLDALKEIEGTFPDRLQIRQGTFPEDFDFRENSIAAIHASHIFEYLNGDDLTIGLSKFYNWLKPGGKVFLLCYTIFTKGMDNRKPTTIIPQ
jgi:SAM-dependent methyltransferase